MKSIRIELPAPPDGTIQSLTTRDAALWIGPGIDTNAEAIMALRRLIELPWKLVLCESNTSDLLRVLEEQTGTSEQMRQHRGFIHIVAADPEDLQLPPRSLPVFLLRGRPDAQDPDESEKLRGNAGLRRRLNMINELATARPQELVVIGNGAPETLEGVFSLWDENFRSRLTLFSESSEDAQRIDQWIEAYDGAPSVSHCRETLTAIADDLVRRLSVDLPETRTIVRVRQLAGELRDVDITHSELPEHPVLDRYELIQSKDLRLLQPEELSKGDFTAFFERSKELWTPFAAGLPWPRGGDARNKVLQGLKRVSSSGVDENCLFYLPCESGAGGTTLAHAIAFEAASQGYPTLIARQIAFRPNPLEIATFLHRALQEIVVRSSAVSDEPVPTAHAYETPWLIVFDVVHWEGREGEIRQFVTHLTMSGRAAVVLWICPTTIPIEFHSSGRTQQLQLLGHELDDQQVQSLGRHLNRFLRHYGREKSEGQWRSFWETHRPNIQSRISAFWIALEFWLRGQLNLGESIQSWLIRTFEEAELSDEIRLLLLEIAALSVERQAMPEGLMPLPGTGQYPYSVQLEEVRLQAPALALVRESSTVQKHWAMAHDLLGRYLLNGVFWNRKLLDRLGLSQATDSVQLRLMLLRRIACRSALARKPFISLAIEFSAKILKLDADGNPEFIPYWQEVLSILENMPAAVRETSRTFNHHVAISRRRVAKHKEFGLSLAEKKRQLMLAIDGLEYALESLQRTSGEEADINLFNSLALAYQDLADIEREEGSDPTRIEQLRTKATQATLNALREDPINPFVLETTAKNLIQNGEIYPEKAASNASEALGYIYQALALERSENRQYELSRLANRALNLLRNAAAKDEVNALCRDGNPLGILAKAWLALTAGMEQFEIFSMADLPPENISEALRMLENTDQKSFWMLLRFRYDLISAGAPQNFQAQVQLLDELVGTAYQMPLQLQLEYAILLHQQNRHVEANRKFNELRRDLIGSDAVVEVPARLRWLLGPDGNKRLCEARVVEHLGERSRAKVRELKDVVAPFLPQEFGEHRMPPGARFACTINFGRRGPFIKRP